MTNQENIHPTHSLFSPGRFLLSPVALVSLLSAVIEVLVQSSAISIIVDHDDEDEEAIMFVFSRPQS
jgi:hypothetical protein